ncbi:MAG: hypothetical protein ACRELS_01635 [Candidatus Rokuibacteriota bacterium]
MKPGNARLLLNQQATQRNLRQVLVDFLRQTDPNSLFSTAIPMEEIDRTCRRKRAG